MEERGRSLDSIIEQYISVVKPMYHQFIEPTKRYADVVIPEGVTNTVAIDLINTKVASILKKSESLSTELGFFGIIETLWFILQGNKIERSFSGDVLFDNINIQVDERDRIALVGRNGAGNQPYWKFRLERRRQVVKSTQNVIWICLT